jgi:hypothetical protein
MVWKFTVQQYIGDKFYILSNTSLNNAIKYGLLNLEGKMCLVICSKMMTNYIYIKSFKIIATVPFLMLHYLNVPEL